MMVLSYERKGEEGFSKSLLKTSKYLSLQRHKDTEVAQSGAVL
jgi:hypothetical protein